jgi:hypothetical protein
MAFQVVGMDSGAQTPPGIPTSSRDAFTGLLVGLEHLLRDQPSAGCRALPNGQRQVRVHPYSIEASDFAFQLVGMILDTPLSIFIPTT